MCHSEQNPTQSGAKNLYIIILMNINMLDIYQARDSSGLRPQNDSVKLQNDIQPILITRKAFIKNLNILTKSKIINKMWFCFFYNIFINFLY